MMRRLMFAALALCAILALESCGASRITGVQTSGSDKSGVLGKDQPTTGAPSSDPGQDEEPIAVGRGN